jgi:DNA-binding beta-propeller fold protein YncE
MRPVTTLALVGALASSGCIGSIVGNTSGDDGPIVDPPPDDPPIPSPAIYRRGSLQPIYQLTPRAEYGRFVHDNVNMSDADFAAAGTAFVSAAQKLDEIGAQIAQERGAAALDLIPASADRQRAQQIPFRGNPSDVKLLEVDGVRRAFVPLGGDLMTPGNEVASVDLGSGAVQRIRVGIRPQRLAVHASGLVLVCNQYSNYVSVIDARTSQLLRTAAGPVEIATEYSCADLILVPRNAVGGDPDEVDLYIANSWRASVLKYGLEIVRDGLSNRPVDVRVTSPAVRNPASQPAAEITGVGTNPQRLALSEAQDSIYVANSRGGELARISISQGVATQRIALGAPAIDVVQIGDSVYVPTTMRDRGLLADDEAALPNQVLANPVVVTSATGTSHVAHPGALFDDTRSYNFEDVRNGLFQVSFLLNNSPRPVYFTDDVSSEPNYVAQQKILAGALPVAIARNRAGTRLYVALSGSDKIQELEVRSGAFRVVPTGRTMSTRERPFALALDDGRDELVVVAWGGEVLEVFDAISGVRRATVDLGYAATRYPATHMERGEYLFYNAEWSNNGRKSCASCHLDELLADGIGFSNGATAPTAYHNVTANFNLMTTDSYFWNGSFANGTYTSLALAAQTRTNCELILFGLIEGISSDPSGRVGDPNNRVRSGGDAQCRPRPGLVDGLPPNFDQIAAVIAQQKQVAANLIQAETGLTRNEVFRFVDFYSVSELRLPPNPLRHLHAAGELDSETRAKIERGAQLFRTAGCATCHDPDNTRHPFADGLNHGAGAGWAEQFVAVYFADPRIRNAIGGIPQQMLEGLRGSTADREINIHLAPIDYFSPFCFDASSCLNFEDPLVVRGNVAAETARLDLLVRLNLADPDRGFIPGNLPGQPTANTPSLRGTWWKSNLLHHGHANTIAEAILPPGHTALRPGEDGFAIDSLGQVDVHGATSGLSVADVEALVLYVTSIE